MNKIEGYLYDHPRAASGVTTVVFHPVGMIKMLLGLRHKGASAYPDTWCHSGGFMNEGEENCRVAACRELKEEMNLDVNPEDLVLFDETSEPDTDPRCHVVNQCYYVVVDNDQIATADPGDDIVDLKWAVPDKTTGLAFNHDSITFKAWQRYQDDVLFAALLKEHNQRDMTKMEDKFKNENPPLGVDESGNCGRLICI